jgi:hypothetical protein
MLDEKTRAAILTLQQAGHGKRAISRALSLSRNAVRKVIASSFTQVPGLNRPEKAEPYHDDIVKLVRSCKGNLVRVHEELGTRGAQLSYPALTLHHHAARWIRARFRSGSVRGTKETPAGRLAEADLRGWSLRLLHRKETYARMACLAPGGQFPSSARGGGRDHGSALQPVLRAGGLSPPPDPAVAADLGPQGLLQGQQEGAQIGPICGRPFRPASAGRCTWASSGLRQRTAPA